MLKDLLIFQFSYLPCIIALFIVPCFAQESSKRSECFDSTADWGTPEFPPQSGDYKVSGFVEIGNSNRGVACKISANGDGVRGVNDEGFYWYGVKSGSWSLVGNIELPKHTENGDPTQTGFMIREQGASSTSKFYSVIATRTDPYSAFLEVIVRTNENAPTRRIFVERISPNRENVWVRVSYYAASNLFYSERSLDGAQWNSMNQYVLEMKSTIAYGLFAANQADNLSLITTRFSEVEMYPATSIVERSVSNVEYESDMPIHVTLDILNPKDSKDILQIKERIPWGWTIQDVSQNGQVNENEIIWNAPVEPGETQLSYHLKPPVDASRVIAISGFAGDRKILGDNYVRPRIQESIEASEGLWRYWTLSDGLADSWCLSIVIAPSGNVWISHISKASCFDGYEIRTYSNPDTWWPVIENPPGQIWSVYGENLVQKIDGLQRLEGTDWIRYPWENISEGINLSFFPVAKNQLLLLTPQELMLYDVEAKSRTTIKNVEDSELIRFRELIPSQDGSFWIAGQRGIAKFSIELNELTSPPLWEEMLLPQDCRLTDYSSPFEDEQRRLFVTGFNMAKRPYRAIILRWNGEEWERLYFTDDHNLVAIPTGADSFFTIEGPGALMDRIGNSTLTHIKNGQKQTVKKGKILSGNVHGAAVDRNGVFWLSTAHGLARYAPSLWSTPCSISHNKNICCSIYEDEENRLWFGCENELVMYSQGKWTTHPMPAGSRFYPYSANSFCTSPEGKLVMTGCGGRMVIFDPLEEIFEIKVHPEQRSLESMFPRKNGGVWLMTRGSYDTKDYFLEIYDWQDFQMYYEIGKETGARGISDLLEGKEGELWLGGRWTGGFGLGMYKDGMFQSYELECPDLCRSMIPVDDSTLWINSGDRLLAYDGQTWSTVRDGFDTVLKMTKDRNNVIWVASYNGLYRFRENSWSLMTESDGLPDAVIYTVFEDSQGRIWAGTSQGISLYNPEADLDPPQTYIPEDLNIRQVSPVGNAQIVFNGIDKWKYTSKDRLLYSYRLDNQGWSPFNENTMAIMQALAPGNHRFEVRAMDRNWNIDPTPAKFEFDVALPWRRQWSFLIFIMGGSLITLAALVYAISRHINLEHLVVNRTRQLRSLASKISLTEQRERRQIAADLHDRIGHGLATCQMQIEILQNKNINGEDTAKVLNKTREIIKQTIQDARTLTVEISPPALYEFGLAPAVKWLIDQMNEQYEMNFQFQENGSSKDIGEDERGILYRAIRECLFNIVKHAHTAHAAVSIYYHNNQVLISVEDDGAGFDHSQLQSNRQKNQSFGLFAIKERMEFIGGKFQCDSRPGKGTRIKLTLPLSKKYTG